MELYFLNGFIFKSDNITNDICFKLYSMALNVLEIILVSSNEYTKYNPIYLCSGIISFCRQYYNLEKWPIILSKNFGVTEKDLDNIIREFFSADDNLSIKNLSIKNNLFDVRLQTKMIILKRYNGKIEDEKYQQNTYNKFENHNHNNKDIKVNVNNPNNEEKRSSQINIFKINNSGMNIDFNYKSTEEIKNSSLFRKINSKYIGKSLRDLNTSNSLNNINRKNELNAILNKEKSSENKLSINRYKTPDKIMNDKNVSDIQSKNENVINNYNKHHRNISNITIQNKNNKILDFSREHQVLFNRDELTNYENNNDNNYCLKERIVKLDKNEERKIYKRFRNKITEEINNNLDNKEEIKVRVNEYCFHKKKSNGNKNIIKNNINSLETDLILGNKNNINSNIKTIINSTYIKNIIIKNNNSTLHLKNSNNGVDNIILKKSGDNSNKNIYINRLSSCNNKFKSKIINGLNREDDYSNETTSENSHNISIRRKYFRLKKFKDISINLKNDNTTSIPGDNIKTESNKEKKQFPIKCNLKYKENKNIINTRDKSPNETKYSKLRDCLKIGSFDRRFQKRING